MKTLEGTPQEKAKELITNFSNVRNIAYDILKPTIRFVVIKTNIFKAIDIILEIHPISTASPEREVEFIEFWRTTKIEVSKAIQASLDNCKI